MERPGPQTLLKTINDSLGHALGDRLLVTLAQRLRAALRDSDTVARMGGDEFIFILPGLRQAADAARPAEKLLEAIRSPVRIEEQELFLTASVGVSVYPADGHEHDMLLRHADTALYRAKARGRNRFELFDRSMTAQAAAKVTLEADLRRACDQDELTLVYQPQLNFRSGEVLGFEALMRWRHPQRGLIPPDTFIPLAEESGLISALGIWALRRACRDLIAWEQRFREPLRIAVNVSPRQRPFSAPFSF
jgi:diguanylate cyclase (GGDEF)-like protein